MNSTETKDSCIREIQVEIPAEVVAGETETIVQKYSKMARLPGFRRGKVPATIIRQRFAEEVNSDVIEALVPKYFRQETEKQGLNPISQPRVSDVHLHQGEPLRFKATFEVLPEIEVSGYQEVRAEHADISVSDEDVEKTLSQLREQAASYNPVLGERPLQDGDFAQVSFAGTPQEGGNPVKVEEVLVEVGGADTVKEFSENLRGAKAGEERVFDVVYPAEFNDQRLAGKTISYKVAVKGIKSKQLPDLTDDFAKEVGSFSSLDELRQRVREGIEADKKQRAEQEGKEKLLDGLVRRYAFPVPESLVERQIDVRLERGLRALAAQGMRAEDLKKMDFGRLREGQREAAVREVKASLVLEKIADTEKIEVGDEEIDKEIDAVAKQSKQTVDAVRARLTREGAITRIRNRLRNEKTLEFLYHKSA